MSVDIFRARLRLSERYPYLSVALWAMVPVARPGFGTFSVDVHWRVYYDPELPWTPEEVEGVLLHELLHLLRVHHARGQALGVEEKTAMTWNIACDAEINDDLASIWGVVLPDGAVYPSTIGQPRGRLAEEYYRGLMAPRGEQGAPQLPESAGPSGPTPSPDEGAGAENGAEGDGGDASETPSDSAAGKDRSADQGDGNSGAASDSPAGPVPQGRAGGQGETSPVTSASPGAPSPSSGPPSTDSGGAGWDTASSVGASPAQMGGSGVHGIPMPWELPPEDAPAVDPLVADKIRRQAAEAVVRSGGSQSRGHIPGAFRRWAEEVLRSRRISWEQVLRRFVRSALSIGADDYTYSRPSRRHYHTGAILPSIRSPRMHAACIIDTSGSMSDAEVRAAIREVVEVSRVVGAEVTAIVCDAEVYGVYRRVTSASQVPLEGGGGTDMCVAIDAALRLHPQPDVIVVMTDGYTPWPRQAPRVPVVVCLIGDRVAPPPRWAKKVKVEVIQ